MQIVYFLILIGVLIFIHEFGHYFWAKVFGVKVERFALGMGPVIKPLSFQKGDTEYAVCAFPIGGYVKMWGMQPEELYDTHGNPLPDELCTSAFVRKPLWQRYIIVLAGPAMNLIFPLFVYGFFALSVSELPPAYVGQVLPEGAAASARPVEEGASMGLQAGDVIVAIDGEPVLYFTDITDHVRAAAGRELRMEIQRGEQRLNYLVVPQARTKRDALGLTKEEYGFLGIGAGSFGPIIGVGDAGSAAARGGLRTFDRVVTIDGKPMESYLQVANTVAASGGRPMKFVVARPQSVDFLNGGMAVGAAFKTTVSAVQVDGAWTLGLEPGSMFVSRVEAGSPAAKAGLQVGDQLLTLDGKQYDMAATMMEDIQQAFWKEMHANPDVDKTEIKVSYTLTWRRNGEVLKASYDPVIRMIKGPFNEPTPELWGGFSAYQAVHFPAPVAVPFSTRVGMALVHGPRESWYRTKLMVTGIVRLIQGKVSTDTIGGPIMIFDLANRAGRAGWEPFVDMMALISINLGLVNLLPIPVLDGGHLMLFTIEAIKRKELNQRTRQIAYYIGLGLIVLLMLLAFKNDITRYWQDFADWFNA